jgi:hypothetical protein
MMGWNGLMRHASFQADPACGHAISIPENALWGNRRYLQNASRVPVQIAWKKV